MSLLTFGRSQQNPCTKCPEPSIPGLIPGAGKCQYHWNAGVWGEAWAEAVKVAAEDSHILKLAELYRPYDD